MLELYIPKLSELWFRQKMLEDPATMSYNQGYGGTIAFPEERWDGWYQRWIQQCDGTRYYRYLRDGNDFVGEIAFHLEGGRWLADVLIDAEKRGRGYGREGLRLLIAEAEKSGIEELCDNIASDNGAGIALFKAMGFEKASETSGSVLMRKQLSPGGRKQGARNGV